MIYMANLFRRDHERGLPEVAFQKKETKVVEAPSLSNLSGGLL